MLLRESGGYFWWRHFHFIYLLLLFSQDIDECTALPSVRHVKAQLAHTAVPAVLDTLVMEKLAQVCHYRNLRHYGHKNCVLECRLFAYQQGQKS